MYANVVGPRRPVFRASLRIYVTKVRLAGMNCTRAGSNHNMYANVVGPRRPVFRALRRIYVTKVRLAGMNQ
jgi:hypothetical protein